MTSLGRRVPLLALYAALVLGGWLVGDAIRSTIIPDVRPMNEPEIHRAVTMALGVYVVAAAIPFVPGAEIGFLLLLAFGAPAAPVVYAGMVGALLLSFTVGRLIPPRRLSAFCRLVGLRRLARAFDAIADRDPSTMRRLVARRASPPWMTALLRNRYLVLALVLNLPGNSVIGGGGGIAFAAGASRLYAPPVYALTILAAVAPVPLFFWLT